MPGRPWTAEEVATLVEWKSDPIKEVVDLARILRRTPNAVARKAHEMGLRRPPIPAEIRFWNLVKRGAQDECWPFLGSTDRKGYGRFNDGASTVTASRFVWKITHGQIPEGLGVLHHCDNPPCCNPAHLFLGTAIDNNADAKAKQRHAHGESHASAKLTNAKVREILRALNGGATRSSLARQHGLCATTVDAIANDRTWRHIDRATID